MAKYKHLTDSERMEIELMLKERNSIKQIAAKIGKSISTVSREIRSRSLASDKYAPYRVHNRCTQRGSCGIRYLCIDKPNCIRRCSTCNQCNAMCPEYDEEICYKLWEPPYVCNGCIKEISCVLQKRYYLHLKAHEAYREMLIESRVGINMTEDEMLNLDEMVSPLIRNGQSVHHIVSSNPDQFSISEKSIYRYVSSGLLKAKNIDMPRVCRLRPRKTKPIVHKIDTSCRIGRIYADFLSFKEQTDFHHIEMDSVIGRIGGKVLLTFMFTSCDFMLAFIRERNTSQSVMDIFNYLYELLEPKRFIKMFPVILTDNGSEFSNPKALEFDAKDNHRTNIFYCDPYASFQKPKVELNHEFIRRILPKGSSFDNLTQNDINLMMSHINSYSREKLNDKSPHDLFGYLFGFDVIEKLGICNIPANDIVLKPALLKK